MAQPGNSERSYDEAATVALSDFDARLGSVARALSGLGVTGHVFGGAVRDALLGRPTADLDLAVDGPAPAIGPKLAEALGGTYFNLDQERGIGRVTVAGADPLTVDVTGAVPGTDIEKHLRRSDFSINAMAVALGDFSDGVAPSGRTQRGRTPNGRTGVIDPTGGIHDLRLGTVRAVSPAALDDDPVRLMRGPRFAAALGFTLEAATQNWICDRAPLITSVSPERVRDELVKLLDAPGVTRSLRMLEKLGLLLAVLPELDASKGVTQPPEHHYYDVFNHLLEAPGMSELVLGDPGDSKALKYVPRFEGMSDYFARPVADGASRSTLLRLAALLHDVSKPAAKTVEPSGRVRFFEHGPLGAKVCTDLMARLRFSRKASQHVATMVEYHLRPGQAAAPGSLPSHRAVYRYHRDLGDVSVDTLYLNLADYMAAKGPDILTPGYDLTEWKLHCGAVERLGEGPDSQRAADNSPSGLVDGKGIMDELSLEPGPVVGELLEMVKEATAVGEIGSRDDALALVRRALKSGRVTDTG
jgi:poly(A) polymerase